MRIASVSGDDLYDRMHDLVAAGHEMKNLDTGQPVTDVMNELVASNAYTGSKPLVEALDEGADVVISGRSTDPSLVLAPLIHEFGWDFGDYKRLAAGTIAGHIIECGAQCTGGNFEGGWWTVPDPANIGYPIIEMEADGTFIVTKPHNTGGLVSCATVSEQVVYELGDPACYLSPDVIVDLTSIELLQVGTDRVRVAGIAGGPPPPTLKVSAAYRDGFINAGTLVFCWPRAEEKARAAADMLLKRIDNLGLRYDDISFEYIGVSSVLRHVSPAIPGEPPEVMLRVALRGSYREDLERFGQELAPIALAGPAAATGFASGGHGRVRSSAFGLP